VDWKSMDVGTKDVIIGFGLVGGMAALAIIIGIIASLTRPVGGRVPLATPSSGTNRIA
jgi:hypothetical protein